VKQLDKLVNVVEIRELHPGHAVERELMLVTVSAEPDRRHAGQLWSSEPDPPGQS
jgi:acetolactate synthase small subunit